ncbi:hypothetical protein SUGI_1177530 [Cryptomeria japonica]|nr:hypothetical protein SUGI_1177530 [Cryptomeria japonica]
MANSILDYNNVIKEGLVVAQPPPLAPSESVDTPSHISNPRTLNAQQLVMEKLRKAAEARKILELNLLKQKMEIEASWCQLPDLEDIDRGAPDMADIISRALAQDSELSTSKEHNGLNTEDPLTLQGGRGGPNLEEVSSTPLNDFGTLENSRGDHASGAPFTDSTPISALKAEIDTTQVVEPTIDPFTPVEANFKQGLTVPQDGFTVVKHRKARRKRSPKNSKDSTNRKESLGPEQISEARKKRGRPSSSIVFDASNIENKEDWPKCFEDLNPKLNLPNQVNHVEDYILEH